MTGIYVNKELRLHFLDLKAFFWPLLLGTHLPSESNDRVKILGLAWIAEIRSDPQELKLCSQSQSQSLDHHDWRPEGVLLATLLHSPPRSLICPSVQRAMQFSRHFSFAATYLGHGQLSRSARLSLSLQVFRLLLASGIGQAKIAFLYYFCCIICSCLFGSVFHLLRQNMGFFFVLFLENSCWGFILGVNYLL